MARAVLTIALVLVAAVPAAAAPPWSEPQRIAGGLRVPTLEFGPSGRGVVHWLTGPGYTPDVPTTRMAAIGADGAVGPAFTAARHFAADALVAIDARDRLVVVGSIPGGGGRYTDTAYATAPVGGRLGKPRRFLPRRAAGLAAASNPAGDVAVLTQVSNRAPVRSTRRALYLTVRRAGGRFTRPQRLARFGPPTMLAVAINERREVVVAWSRSGRVFAQLRRSDGRLGRVHRIAADASVGFLEAALSPTGQAVVAWSSHLPGSEAPPPGDADMRAVVRPAGGPFGAVQELDHVRAAAIAGLDLAVVGQNRILIAWNGEEGDRRVARAADVHGATTGPPRVLSSPGVDAGQVQLDAGPRGEAVALWAEPRGGDPGFDTHALVAAVRAPGADICSPPEEITGPIRLFGDSVAVDPASGRVMAAWTEVAGRDAFAQVATRPPIGP